MAIAYTAEDYRDTLTFLRDVLSDYRHDKSVGFEVLALLLGDPKLETRAREHVETFYPEGFVKGLKP